ncbi:uncharacterized protein PSFLO_06558 [Pseudozyma flocculosa]|uniref:Uncharacterized protein n=1 Tax=Pseudozyma flocculosa TaxID=84751 RepID=A0A5C3FAD6_9BASI|nr:uncharacterized protein PSFLO_06558 [Pseudozyma flocculosa]
MNACPDPPAFAFVTCSLLIDHHHHHHRHRQPLRPSACLLSDRTGRVASPPPRNSPRPATNQPAAPVTPALAGFVCSIITSGVGTSAPTHFCHPTTTRHPYPPTNLDTIDRNTVLLVPSLVQLAHRTATHHGPELAQAFLLDRRTLDAPSALACARRPDDTFPPPPPPGQHAVSVFAVVDRASDDSRRSFISPETRI